VLTKLLEDYPIEGTTPVGVGCPAERMQHCPAGRLAGVAWTG
jgi:hypothetical protein